MSGPSPFFFLIGGQLLLFVVTRCLSLLDVALSLLAVIMICVCFLLSRGTSEFFVCLSRSVVVVVVVNGDCGAVGRLCFSCPVLSFHSWFPFFSFFVLVCMCFSFLLLFLSCLCLCRRRDRNALPSFAPGGGGGRKGGGGADERKRRWVVIRDASSSSGGAFLLYFHPLPRRRCSELSRGGVYGR